MPRAARVCVLTALLGAAAWLGAPALKILFRAAPLCLQARPPHLPMPVQGVRPSQVADTFGAPRSGRRRHHGVDIFAPRNRPVLSTTDGVVLAVGPDRLGGRTVRVLGPGAECHYYAHLESYGAVEVGQRILAGHVLGTVGDSGNAQGTPTHLHYGVYAWGGSASDPLPRLRSW